jgi:hypothetical protein
MSQDESTNVEDLELDGSAAESIVGGRVSTSRFESMQAAEEEIFRLAEQGYVETACISNGTLMENPSTKHRIAVKYS